MTVWLSVQRRRQGSPGPLENKKDVPLLLEGEEVPSFFSAVVLNDTCFHCPCLIPPSAASPSVLL